MANEAGQSPSLEPVATADCGFEAGVAERHVTTPGTSSLEQDIREGENPVDGRGRSGDQGPGKRVELFGSTAQRRW